MVDARGKLKRIAKRVLNLAAPPDPQPQAAPVAPQPEPAPADTSSGLDIDFHYTLDDEAATASVASLLAQIRTQQIQVISGGGSSPYRHRLNTRQTDLRSSIIAATDLFGSDRIWIRYRQQWSPLISGGSLDQALVHSRSVDALLLDEPLLIDSVEPGSSVSATGVWLEFVSWEEHHGAYGRSYMETTRASTVAKRLRPTSFERLANEHHHFGGDLPAADVPSFPIDIVYTWVDDGDPEWLREKESAQAAHGIENTAGSVLSEERFHNRDELKYSLRSVEKYAPWVRTIHIVTAGQCPDWLNVDHDKIRLVDHSEIYTDPNWLPTFNSSGIETQLHHVPGLAEKFLYFNDDFFLGDYCNPDDFFYGNGIIKYFPSTQMAYEHDIDESSEEYIQADKNALRLLAGEFSSMNRHIMQHVPYPSDRLLLEELEQKFPDEFAGSARQQFRSSTDLRPIAFMQYHYGFHHGRAMPAEISHRYLALWKDAIFEQFGTVLELRNHKTFCINDVGLQAERKTEVNSAVTDFLETYFPTPSSFER